jgi:FSR family fosmidomycin resistance protein-like MFS transporter
MVGFAIGTGGLGVTLLGVLADHYGVATALESIIVLPVAGFLLAFFIKYPAPEAQQEVTQIKPAQA